MLARVYSCAVTGLAGTVIEVEVDASVSQEPKTIVVGLPDTAVQESKERVPYHHKPGSGRSAQGRSLL